MWVHVLNFTIPPFYIKLQEYKPTNTKLIYHNFIQFSTVVIIITRLYSSQGVLLEILKGINSSGLIVNLQYMSMILLIYSVLHVDNLLSYRTCILDYYPNTYTVSEGGDWGHVTCQLELLFTRFNIPDFEVEVHRPRHLERIKKTLIINDWSEFIILQTGLSTNSLHHQTDRSIPRT